MTGRNDAKPDAQVTVVPLDRDGPTALYLQIAADLAMRIGQEEGFRDRLPSEAALVTRYGVSRITIRLALDHLARRGLVVRRQGRGTFVAPERNAVTSEPIHGLADILAAQGVEPELELLAFGPAPAPAPVVEALGLESADALLLRRSYHVAGQPAALTEVFYPPSVGSAFTRTEAEAHSSVMLLTRFAGLRLVKSDITVRVQVASTDLAEILQVPAGTALMVIRRITYTEAGNPCEYSTLFARAGVAEFAVTASGTDAQMDGFRPLSSGMIADS